MEITSTQQLQQLFLSCGMGFILGAYYDVFRVTRLAMRSGKKWLFAQDVFFFLTSAVVTFLFSLAFMDGQLRFYLFLGEAVGFAAYYYTFGRLVMRFAGAVIQAVLYIWNGLWKIILFPFRLLGHLLSRPLTAFYHFIQKIGQKILLILKKGLKHIPFLLYNHRKVSKSEHRTYIEGK